jgi:glycosyltransferase 2 family protein
MQLRKYLRPLIVSVALAIVIYLAIALALDWQNSYRAFMSLSLGVWLLILSLTLMNFIFRGVRWHGYMLLLGHRIPLLKDLAIYLAGLAFTTTPGKVGETVRSVYLKQLGVPYAHSIAALIVERLIDVITMVFLSLFCVFAFSQYQSHIVVILLAAVGILIAVRSERVQNWLAERIAALASAKVKTLGEHVIDLLQAVRSLLKTGPLLAGLALGLIAWGAEGFVLQIILVGLGVDIGWPVAVGVYAIAILAGAISFIPGGLGSTEAVMGGSLVLLGVEPGTAVAATLICRLVTLWPAVAIGLGFVLALEGSALAVPAQSQAPLAPAQARESEE